MPRFDSEFCTGLLLARLTTFSALENAASSILLLFLEGLFDLGEFLFEAGEGLFDPGEGLFEAGEGLFDPGEGLLDCSEFSFEDKV